jgi:fibronectin type 3 domain-containing protein
VTTVEGAAGEPVCETPVDRFAPAAPAQLAALPGDGGIELTWVAVTAADLAGYVVLRGDGAGGTLQALMTTPMTATSYRDQTVTSGVTYVYAVVALDQAGNPSTQSNRVTVIAR